MKSNEELFAELDKQIADLKAFDSQLDSVVSAMLKSLQKSKRIDNTGSGLVPYKDLKKSPQYVEAVSSLVKTQLETKKALIKAFIDEINMSNKSREVGNNETLYKELLDAAKKIKDNEEDLNVLEG